MGITAETDFRTIGKFFVAIFVFFCTLNFVSCLSLESEDDEDRDEAVVDQGYVGDPFDDVPEAYVLSRSTTPSSALPGKGDKDYPYRIRNASDLLCFINMVNDGSFYVENEISNVYTQLEHDIEVDEKYPWTPIGTSYYWNTHVWGEFDGKGHSITGTLDNEVAIDDQLAQIYVGFFGVTSFTIKNLTIAADIDVSYSVTDGEQGGSLRFAAGGLAAWTIGIQSIENCKFTGRINIENVIEANMFCVGGLIGEGGGSDSVGLSDCTSDGTINFKNLAAENVFIGGICGWSCGEGSASVGRFDHCVNKTDITLDGYKCDRLYLGGIYGAALDDINLGGRADYVVSCENYGNISITRGKRLYLTGALEELMANTYVGGIIGSAENTMEFSGNINHADIFLKEVESNSYVGGLCGVFGAFMNNCENDGAVSNSNDYSRVTGGCVGDLIGSSDIYLCRNTNDVFGSGKVGGIVGGAYDGEVHLCTNSGNISGAPSYDDKICYVGGIAGCSSNSNSVYSCCVNDGEVQGELAPKDYPYFYYIGAGNPVVMCNGDHSRWE